MDTLESSPRPSILRLIGMLTMVGAGLTTVGLISLLVGADGRGNTGVIAAACLISGVLLLLVGIAGLHLRQRHASGKMGVIGIGLMFLGIARRCDRISCFVRGCSVLRRCDILFSGDS